MKSVTFNEYSFEFLATDTERSKEIIMCNHKNNKTFNSHDLLVVFLSSGLEEHCMVSQIMLPEKHSLLLFSD